MATFESWFLQTHGMVPQIIVNASSFNALPSLVVGMQCIATMHTRLAQIYARLLPMRVLPARFEIPVLKLVMQWNRHRAHDAAHLWLRERLMAVAAHA